MPPYPKDPRHQRIADLILAGSSKVDAYLASGFKSTRASAYHAVTRVLRRPDVKAYFDHIKNAAQAAAEQASVLTVLEKRQFLARVVRTPLATLDATDPSAKDGDLIKSYSLTESEASRSERIEKLDPLKAIEIDNTLSGDDGQRDLQQALHQALASLAVRSALPDAPMPLE